MRLLNRPLVDDFSDLKKKKKMKGGKKGRRFFFFFGFGFSKSFTVNYNENNIAIESSRHYLSCHPHAVRK
uniref:Uncharacterized protein n=1 Tax=Rhizophora mucronata TaxID=61149 RepID=A0A2P2MN16_RHIMU